MLVELSPRVGYVPGGVNVGVLRGEDGRVVLVDTGLNETSGKKALRAVREAGWGEVAAILTTHAHADHFGGNAAVVKRTGARVYAPVLDEAVLRYPLLQPTLLYGGADPLDALRGRFLLADPSPVDAVIEAGTVGVAGIGVAVVPLPGHSPNQVGYLVDGVFFCADVVLPAAVLDKYRIPYLYSVTDHLRSLAAAVRVPFSVAVPGHGPTLTAEEFAELVALNRALIDAVAERVLVLVAEPATAEAVLTGLLRYFGAEVVDAPGYYLLQPTALAFLSHLAREGSVAHEVRDGRALWRATAT